MKIVRYLVASIVCIIGVYVMCIEGEVFRVKAVGDDVSIEINSVAEGDLITFLSRFNDMEAQRHARQIIYDRNMNGCYWDKQNFYARTVPTILSQGAFNRIQGYIKVMFPSLVIPYEYYHISSNYSGNCLDVSHGSDEDEAKIIQSVCDNKQHQRFKFVLFPNMQYQIRAEHSEKCLGVDASSKNDGAMLKQYFCQPSLNQRFWVTYIGSESYIIQAVHSWECLSVKDRSVGDNAIIQQEACRKGNNNQKWKIW
jgi:hypothetical protein